MTETADAEVFAVLPALEVDAVVIGAGPVGLFQVFQLGLQGVKVHLIDALPYLGGQCVQLYPDKPIYDIPGIPVCTGRELAERLTTQIGPFAPVTHLNQQVSALQRQADGRLFLQTSTGTQLLTRTVFIAAGVGAFVPRAVKVEGIETLVGTQVLYHPPETGAAKDRNVIVHGGDEDAVRAAVAAAGIARSVTLLHRRDVFQADAADLERLAQLRDAGRIRVVAAQITGIETSESGQLTALSLLDAEGEQRSEPLDLLLVYLGISPRLGPIADWGLALERKQLVVDTASFMTDVPGIYAVGDINTYPGKRKLILCGFHEATLAAFAAAEYLSGAPVALQYTTTSSKLHERLGVEHG
ncbi:NAD(P)/FAD-dependent oxidoreductase [Diaphorobacter aerolatus]|uniref:Ferredoxin--NADP reductase n=1 Tax=Diaphorobacter aerolatus TaxID=1288495 RepID=A0A7H0GL83_9BURK|nr:NAD(P)/FAD-dependent oxidoreductase [Diaphorobacter aerolatus]QNP49049.1 NAD(P)/FAD-dependent oxidoreductase [Diaphorobacter aerolatus]